MEDVKCNEAPPLRKCAYRTCVSTMEHRAPQARFCSNACKQADYRERTDPVNQPSCVLVAPTVREVVALPGGAWRVIFDDAEITVTAHGARHARTVARMMLAKRVK